jgi:hypothetical protein
MTRKVRWRLLESAEVHLATEARAHLLEARRLRVGAHHQNIAPRKKAVVQAYHDLAADDNNIHF